MDEVIAQTRRTINLVTQLDLEAEAQLDNADTTLKSFYKAPAKSLAKEAITNLDRAHFLRINTVSEARYLQEYVDDAYDRKKKELEIVQTKLQQHDDVVDESETTGHAGNEPLYCTCRRGFFGQMIACDNPKCPIEWYHLPCVGLKSAPRGDWYCAICQKKDD